MFEEFSVWQSPGLRSWPWVCSGATMTTFSKRSLVSLANANYIPNINQLKNLHLIENNLPSTWRKTLPIFQIYGGGSLYSTPELVATLIFCDHNWGNDHINDNRYRATSKIQILFEYVLLNTKLNKNYRFPCSCCHILTKLIFFL